MSASQHSVSACGLTVGRAERAIGICLLVTAVGCEHVVAPQAATMTAISATSEDYVAGTPVPPPATVIVRDAQGQPVSGVRVTFVDSSRPQTLDMTTGRDGKAMLLWLIGNRSGVYHLIASAEGLPSVTFNAVVHPGPATQLVSDVGLDQVGEAGEALPVWPTVRVADAFGNGIPGVNVTFTAAGDPGAAVEHPTAVTDSSGHATAGAWHLGSAPGDYLLTAAAVDVPAKAVTFRARVNAPFAVSSLAAGGTSSCAIARGGTYCWGSLDGTSSVLTPALLSGAPPLVTLAVGLRHACGLTSSGAAYCWGRNMFGQLGLGTRTEAEPQPRAVTGGLSFTTLVVGASFTCGVSTDHQMYCWGDNSLGQLGNAGTVAYSIPTAVATSERIATMAAGSGHVCATATSGTTYCWGEDDTGQLGQGTSEICTIRDGYYYYLNVPCSTTPRPLPNAPGAFTALTAGYGTCGLLGNGEAYCWGFSRSTAPTPGHFVSLAAAARSVCGITTTQSISCWSYADSTALPSELTVVPGITDPVGLVGGQTHWCAMDGAAMTAFCWGGNDAGQLGNGTRVSTTRPLPVTPP
jgi:regulator of chromosome condensation (RCC1) repeat-containing protein/Big-like domain-containing protein/carboxypeptidase family protein